MKKLIKNIIIENDIPFKGKPGFPDIGKRKDNQNFSLPVKKIEEAWYYYDSKLYEYVSDNKIIKLGTGNPVNYKAFPYAIKKVKKNVSKKLFEYPPAAGDEECRNEIANYLKSIDFPNEINKNNIIITCSTTQGFYLILKSIFREYDTIIMTAPNYGLFAFMPERLNINVETIRLEEKDNYIINCEKLDLLVKKINDKLKKKYNNLNYTPRVKAFLNINPSNPLGTVMSKSNYNTLKKLAETCRKNNMFVIDDLIYRDICYDRNNLAVPLGTINNYFDYSISLFGLSKSYGMANTRSGFVVANEHIIRTLRNNLFYIMDSAPYIQSSLLAACYNTNKKRTKCYNKYFYKLTEIYKYNCMLMVSMIDGINSITIKKHAKKIKSDIHKIVKDKKIEYIFEGIPYTHVKIIPQAGYFLLVDFTELSMHSNIKTEEQLLKLLYTKCGSKFLIGQSFSWPNEKEIIARFSFSLSKKEIINILSKINLVIREVVNETNRNNSKS